MLSIHRGSLVASVTLAALVLAMSGLNPAAGSESQKTGDEKSRAAIMALLEAHQEHWNRHDMDAWADALLHDDSDWVHWRGGYWRGKAAIKAGHQEIHRTFYRASRLSSQRIEDLTFLTRDIALAHVRNELSGDERAPGQVFQYRMTILFTKQNGVWRIRALHNTRLQGVE
jgi:uncharacterized protein (TIGR02246 family)